MPKNFNLASLKWRDPRVAMRALLGVLLVANLATAVVAFKPFGGGADDLRRERNALQQQLAQLAGAGQEQSQAGAEDRDRAQPGR